MRATRTRTVTPDEDVAPYPYRRVWRSLTIEVGTLAALTGVIFALFGVLGVALPAAVQDSIRLLIGLAPLALWLLFSIVAERQALQPRTSLITVAVITALAANAVTIPFIEQVLQPQAWLSHSSAITRIVGYTLTVGVATEFTKYIVLRYTVWPGHLQTRMDGIAYAIAASIGFATIWNLRAVFGPQESLDALAVTVFDTTVTGLAAGLVIGYGLSESAIGQPSPFMGPFSLAIAALAHGIAIPLRTGLVNASFSLSGGNAILILGSGISAGLIIVIAFIIS
ncbi:MAG TPA: PrsW family glutamic-type intramembrane protease, partial [Candidatus Limnocylindrales bacterium]|nr:PrsW family glutamic-type intramembrane protease [Candidatus Limnocylindrales bacterium]